MDWNFFNRVHNNNKTSHPTWVCGLKHSLTSTINQRIRSHPTWVCGLKQLRYANYPKDYFVTPYVGVWIETDQMRAQFGIKAVTPYVGVWIETFESGKVPSFAWSHPTWVCGLKLKCSLWRCCCDCHTLRGCVDWNLLIRPHIPVLRSHTLRGCVDWNDQLGMQAVPGLSHPTWVCGLKPTLIMTLS